MGSGALEKKRQEEEIKRVLFSFLDPHSPIDHELEETSRSLEATISKVPS
jgi:hypothetical protein